MIDCIQWRYQYDARTVTPAKKSYNHPTAGRNIIQGLKQGFQLERDPREDAVNMCEGSYGGSSMSGESSGYLSGNWEQDAEEVHLSPEEEKEFWTAVGGCEARARLKSVLSRMQHEDRLSLSSLGQDEPGHEELSPRPSLHHPADDGPGGGTYYGSSGPHSLGLPLVTTTTTPPTCCNVGQLLTNLFICVQGMDKNTLALNLRLTSVLSKLASFPQPLLRSILTHPDPVLQPGCPSLIQAICTVRSRIDASMPALPGAEEAVKMARLSLNARVSPERKSSNAAVNALSSLPATLGEYSRRGSKLFGISFGGRRSTSSPSTKSANAIPQHTHRMAMAAVVLEEWIQELAAIAHAHSLAEQQAAILG